MDFYIIFLALLLTLTEMQAKQLDPGPQALKDSQSTPTSSPSSTQKSQKRYATKEIILYLTPSQIKALQGGNGVLTSQPLPEETQAQNDQRISFKEHDEFVRQQFENIKAARISPLEKSQYDNLELFSHGPSYKKEVDSSSTENQQKNLDLIEIWKEDQAGIKEQIKLQDVVSQIGQNKQIEQWSFQNVRNLEGERNAWAPIESIADKKQEEQLLNEQLKQQWNRILEQNRIQLKNYAARKSEQEDTASVSTQTEKPLLQLQYSPRYNDQKNAIEIENILRTRHRQELEKESALVKAESIANAAPILIHQEIKVTKHQPVPVVKHVQVQVPTPVLVPVPEPFEVKVPHPYPVPLEIIKTIPVPVLKTAVERAVPIEAEKQIKVPYAKKVYGNVERPYYIEKYVPVEIKKRVPVEVPIRKPEKVTILRHVWQH